MTAAPRGTSGDRRRNPFPSFTDTEYELFMATIREEARIGASSAISAHLTGFCDEHRERTEHVEAVVFGRSERGIVGLDQRVANVEGVMERWDDDRVWFKRMVYSALTVAVIGVAIGLIQFALLGR